LRFISIHPALRQRQLRYASTTDGNEVPEQQSIDQRGLPSSPVYRKYPNSPLLTEMDILSSSDPERPRTVMAYGMFDKAGIAFLLGARDNPDTTGLEDEGGEPMLGRVGLHGAAGDPLAATYARRSGGVNIHGVQVGVQGDGFGQGVPGERDYWHVDLWGWSLPGHAFTSRRFYRENCVTHPHKPRAPETGGNGWWFFDTTGAGLRADISTSEDADNVIRITPDMVKRAWSKPRQLVEQGWVTP
jgi:hypothetical protein